MSLGHCIFFATPIRSVFQCKNYFQRAPTLEIIWYLYEQSLLCFLLCVHSIRLLNKTTCTQISLKYLIIMSRNMVPGMIQNFTSHTASDSSQSAQNNPGSRTQSPYQRCTSPLPSCHQNSFLNRTDSYSHVPMLAMLHCQYYSTRHSHLPRLCRGATALLSWPLALQHSMHGLTTCIDTGTMLWGCECRDTSNKRGAHPITKGTDTAKEGTGTGNGKGNDVQYLLSLRRDFLVKMSFNYRVSE